MGGVRIFVVGATGVLGRRVVSQARARGHEVLGLARTPENESVIAASGGEPRPGDPFDPDSLAKAARGAEVVVRAATAIPHGVRFRARDWAENDRVRRDGTRALTQCAARIGARMYVQEGIVWVAQPADGSSFDEQAPVSPRLWYASAADAEAIARDAGERHGFAVGTLRFGAFYAADSAQTRLMGERLAQGTLPILGRGDAVWSCIHVEDAASAILLAAESGVGGLWHVVDDRPVTMEEFFTTFAQLLGAPKPRHAPAWLARLAVGGPALSFLTASTRTTSAKIRRDLGWSPRYPTVHEGLRQVVETWAGEGFPVK
ncbi:MAG: NAD-dependent epimerase/dehydratase family protein [Methanobacteriota archaeon]